MFRKIFLSVIVFTLTGCSSLTNFMNFLNPKSNDVQRFTFPNDQTQAQRRSYQTRQFDAPNQSYSLRVIIATLQDLGFVITKADLELGVVSGKQIYKGDEISITVTTTPKPMNQISVRVALQNKQGLIDSLDLYQEFFSYLQKSYFLADNEIN